MACYTEKQIQEAEEQYKKITADEKMMAIIEMRERAKREMEEDKYAARKAGWKDGMEEGKKAGIEEGKKQGMKEVKKKSQEIARKLKETGMEIKQIAEITGLSEEEIDKL